MKNLKIKIYIYPKIVLIKIVIKYIRLRKKKMKKIIKIVVIKILKMIVYQQKKI